MNEEAPGTSGSTGSSQVPVAFSSPDVVHVPASLSTRSRPASTRPPALLWVPLVAGLTLWGLRMSKAALLAAEYQRKAREATGGDLRQP